MTKSKRFINKDDNIRLDQALSKVEDISSRSRAQDLIEMGKVQVNGSLAQKASQKVFAGDELSFTLPDRTPSRLVPQKKDLDIFFEDDELLVVNKPAGLVVHPSPGHEDLSLVHALLYHCKNLSVGYKEERPGIVHRIDKDTSGLLVIAKTDRAQNHLAQQFKNKSVLRKYWALCFGIPTKTQDRIESLIGRSPNERKKFSSKVTSGKVAITNYRKLATYKNEISLVSLQLETGRTHQIRVHLNDMGHPILADWFYCSKRRLNTIESSTLRKKIENLDRFALHAAELGFTHPLTNEDLFFKAPPPEDLKDILTFCEFMSYSEIHV